MFNKGFNLIGLMVAIAIVGILAAVTFVVVNPAGHLSDINDAKRLVDVKNIENAINRYTLINHTLPTEVDSLTNRQAYVIIPSGLTYNTPLSCNSILGYLNTTTISSFSSYLATVPTDPSVTNIGTYGSGYYIATINDIPKVGSCYQPYDFNNSLVALWKFDESVWNGTVDEVRDWSNTTNDAQAVGGITNTATNYKLGSKAFSGDGTAKYLSFPYHSSLNLTSAFTVSAWIYQTTTARKVIVGRGYAWEFYLNNAALGLYLKRGVGDGTGDRYVQCSSNVGVTTNQWQHVAATFQPGTVKFYLNGSLIVTRTDATGCADYGNCVPAIALHSVTSGSGEIGTYWSHAGYHWNGQMDEVAVWNRVLSDNEIAALYNAQATSVLLP